MSNLVALSGSAAPAGGRLSVLAARLRVAQAVVAEQRETPPRPPSQRFAFAPSPSATVVDPLAYDMIIVAFSGGKDSLALLLLLLLLGMPRERIELWHHDVDGREGSTLMDWPCTRDYCRRVAAAFGVAIYYSWKVGGFEGEMLRDQTPTAGYVFETPEGIQSAGGKSDNLGTRLQFPQQAADLSVRWCSAYTKIMVMQAALRNQERVAGLRTLVLTGERAEESSARSKYEVFEPDRADLRNGKKPRLIDHWRPVHRWKADEVWALIERFRVNPHPAYRLGWGRVSCAACIFGSPDQWASLRVVNPQQFAQIAAYEQRFGKTIDRKLTVVQKADKGRPFEGLHGEGMRAEDIRAALSTTFNEPAIIDPWVLPAGCYGDVCGPT